MKIIAGRVGMFVNQMNLVKMGFVRRLFHVEIVYVVRVRRALKTIVVRV